MDKNQFKELVENFFESIHLSEMEKKYVCKIYYTNYVEKEKEDDEQNLCILCANILAEIFLSESNFELPEMPIESFREIMLIQPIKFPFDCSYIYRITEDMCTCEGIFGQEVYRDEFTDELFEEKIKLNKTNLKKLYNMQKNIINSCAKDKVMAHKILENWLNSCIMPKYKTHLITEEDMKNIIMVAEMVEEHYKPYAELLKYTESMHLMFDDNKDFNGVLSAKVLVDEIIKLLDKKLKAGTKVQIRSSEKIFNGVIIGIQDEENYIVQHTADNEGYTATVVSISDIKEGV